MIKLIIKESEINCKNDSVVNNSVIYSWKPIKEMILPRKAPEIPPITPAANEIINILKPETKKIWKLFPPRAFIIPINFRDSFKLDDTTFMIDKLTRSVIIIVKI